MNKWYFMMDHQNEIKSEQPVEIVKRPSIKRGKTVKLKIEKMKRAGKEEKIMPETPSW